jgi:hypothetical protein
LLLMMFGPTAAFICLYVLLGPRKPSWLQSREPSPAPTSSASSASGSSASTEPLGRGDA